MPDSLKLLDISEIDAVGSLDGKSECSCPNAIGEAAKGS